MGEVALKNLRIVVANSSTTRAENRGRAGGRGVGSAVAKVVRRGRDKRDRSLHASSKVARALHFGYQATLNTMNLSHSGSCEELG
jgi:hypothetical protein